MALLMGKSFWRLASSVSIKSPSSVYSHSMGRLRSEMGGFGLKSLVTALRWYRAAANTALNKRPDMLSP